MERDLTTGSIGRNILKFSLPYFLSYFLQTLYGMADLFIIGQFNGVASTTAVSIGSQVMHMITVMIVGIAMGTTVMIGKSVGAKQKKETSKIIGNTVSLFVCLSVVLTVVLLFFVHPIVRIMSTPQQAVEGTTAYLTICFAGIPLITAYNIISSIFRGLGDSKSPMYFIAVACGVNIVLDYVFIGGLHFGASGAALGTTLAQTISVIVALIAIRKKDTGISLKRSDLKPEGKTLKNILGIGIPISLQDGFIENERLDAAAEPVEIQAGKGRDADLEQLDLAKHPRQPAKEHMAQACQGPVQQCGDDRTGQDVAEVTERHADRGRDL